MAESTHRRLAPCSAKKDSNLFSILKNSMGKELSSITMPVEFNEPLSFLQRISEYMEYADLLRQADHATDPTRRMQLVCAFAVSALASNWERLRKPFNPLLGETFELCTSEWRLACEQVCHHPPVSAFHAEGQGGAFSFFGDVHPRLRFWGKSLDIKPEGALNVALHRHNEMYSWSNVHCCVHNIVIGKLWFEQYGEMEVKCAESGLIAQLHFKPAGWFGKDLHRVEGFVVDSRSKQKLSFLYGRWTEFLDAASMEEYEEHAALFAGEEEPGKKSSKLHVFTRSMTGGSKSPEPPSSPSHEEPPPAPSSLRIAGAERLWSAHPRPPDSEKYYNFTSFAMSLNEPPDEGSPPLPPTDSRLRPDVRRLEEGDAEGAAAEKARLEERQRDARRERKRSKGEWTAGWFRRGRVSHLKGDAWIFTGDYWKRDFSASPHIF